MDCRCVPGTTSIRDNPGCAEDGMGSCQNSMKEPLHVAITEACSTAARLLSLIIANGEVFGPKQPVILSFLDDNEYIGKLVGVAMDLEDCGYPIVQQVMGTISQDCAFCNADVVFVLQTRPKMCIEYRRNTICNNAKLFKAYGESMNRVANKNVKVLFVGERANTNAFLCSYYAPDIPPENFTTLTHLYYNYSIAIIAERLKCITSNIGKVIIWGNSHSTTYPDARFAKVTIGKCSCSGIWEIIDTNYLREGFVDDILSRTDYIYNLRGDMPGMTIAKAAAEHMYLWWHGTQPNAFISMGVRSDGSYNVPRDIIFSFPCEIVDKKWKIIQGINLDDYTQQRIRVSVNELLDEKQKSIECLARLPPEEEKPKEAEPEAELEVYCPQCPKHSPIDYCCRL